MNEAKQEIISIKRSLESLDGKIISYLKSDPLKLDTDFSEIVIDTLKAYWLPFVMYSFGVRDEELRRVGIWSIKQLEAQASLIREVFGIPSQLSTIASVVSTTPYPITAQDMSAVVASPMTTQAVSSNALDSTTALSNGLEVEEEAHESDYNYEDDLISMELTDEMKTANSLFTIES